MTELYSYDTSVLNTVLGEHTDMESINYAKIILESNDPSPVRNKLQNKYIESILKKSDMNFGSIPVSRGNLKDWDYYPKMMEVLKIIRDNSENNITIKTKCDIIEKAIDNIIILSPNYSKGFLNHNKYVMTEYNLYVLCVIQAITSILTNSVSYEKSLVDGTVKIKIIDTRDRTADFYFNILTAFNNTIENNSLAYRKMLDSFSENGDRNNFTGVELVGLAAITSVILLIVPLTRELIYHFYKLRNCVADSLELQSKFLIMNRHCVESNYTLNATKKKKIIEKQEALSKVLENLSSKIRVNTVKASRDSSKEITKDNKSFTIDEIKKDISNSPIELL